MPSAITLVPHLSPEQLQARYRREPHKVERSQWHILWLVASGRTADEVAAVTGFHRSWVFSVVRRYNAGGAAAIVDRRRGRKSGRAYLTDALRAELTTALEGPAPDGGLWTAARVAKWLEGRLGHPVHTSSAWRYMRELGFTLQEPRPRHQDADPAAQEAFKKKRRKSSTMWFVATLEPA